MYDVIISDAALDDLHGLPKTYQRLILQQIKSLKEDPRHRGVKKLHDIGSFYRIRKGPYRVIFKIDDTRREITIYRIKPRREAYR
jgi:mRNA interferase RelE/StbE